ncbi:MAG: hypothetical protein Q8Q89_01265 [bacterium]|nr:hypothetical protein [bacterium]
MNFKSKPIILISIVIAVGIAFAGFWYWSKNRQAQKEVPTLGSQIFDKTQNQLQGQVPDANPFKNQKNPLDVIYKNPFE